MDNNEQLKPDFLNRRTEDVSKIFGLAQRDFMALMLTISLMSNVYLTYKIIDIVLNMSSQITEEVRKQGNEMLQPVVDKVESTTSKLEQEYLKEDSSSTKNKPN